MSQVDQEIRARVDAFVQELAELVRQAALDAVSEGLGGGPGRGRRRGRHPAAPSVRGSRRPKGQKRTPEELEQLVASLLRYIKAHPGQRIEQVGAGMKIRTKELVLPAKKLIADKKVRTTGHKRATTYFPK